MIAFEGKKMHPSCFRCSGPCGEPLPGKFMKGTTDGKPYCSTCYANAFAPRCDKCNKPIAPTASAMSYTRAKSCINTASAARRAI